MKRKPPLERYEDAYIRKLYRTAGCVVVSFSQPRRTKQTPGIPDLRIYDTKTGTAWWHEVKRQQGPGWTYVQTKQSDAQRLFQARAEACGEEYLIGARDVAYRKLRDLGRIL